MDCPIPGCVGPDGKQWHIEHSDKSYEQKMMDVHLAWHSQNFTHGPSSKQVPEKKSKGEKQITR